MSISDILMAEATKIADANNHLVVLRLLETKQNPGLCDNASWCAFGQSAFKLYSAVIDKRGKFVYDRADNAGYVSILLYDLGGYSRTKCGTCDCCVKFGKLALEYFNLDMAEDELEYKDEVGGYLSIDREKYSTETGCLFGKYAEKLHLFPPHYKYITSAKEFDEFFSDKYNKYIFDMLSNWQGRACRKCSRCKMHGVMAGYFLLRAEDYERCKRNRLQRVAPVPGERIGSFDAGAPVNRWERGDEEDIYRE